MATSADQLRNVLARVDREGIEHIRLEFLDTNAVARSKTIPARNLEEKYRSGILFPAKTFVYDPQGNLPSVESPLLGKFFHSDVLFYPDLSTYTALPWVENTGRVYISRSAERDVHPEVLIDPRNILRAQLKALTNEGLSILATFEYEFWLVDEKSMEPINRGQNSFATLRLSKHGNFLDSVSRNLHYAGVDVDYIHSEFGAGLVEMTMKPSFGIGAADCAATFRTGVKEMALQRGLMASFMAKPSAELNPAGAHLNHSLWSVDGETPLLSSESDPRQLSKVGEHWLAGLLEHARALSVLQAPTMNCREFFRPDEFIPADASWGLDNRTCAVRVKPRGNRGMYLENRIGTGAGNPYISLAATIAAGIDGIGHGLGLPPPVPTNKTASRKGIPRSDGEEFYPTDMENALACLKADTVMADAIGPDFIAALESIRRSEMKEMDREKFRWSRDSYYEYI